MRTGLDTQAAYKIRVVYAGNMLRILSAWLLMMALRFT